MRVQTDKQPQLEQETGLSKAEREWMDLATFKQMPCEEEDALKCAPEHT
jgi:hypothetical protein